MKVVLLFFTFFFLCFSTIAQNRFQYGFLPSINLNNNISEKWNLNFKTESRQLIKKGFFNEENTANYEYVLTDLTVISSKKVGLNNALGGGYTLRLRDKDFIHRTIQQFTITQEHSFFRLAHRFSSDQTFEKNEPIEVRFRYRLTLELPLNGQSVDPKEFYLKVNNEYLNVFKQKEYDLELRLVPLLGYEFNDNNKLEAGLDYRVNSFINDDASSSFWLSMSWFIKI